MTFQTHSNIYPAPGVVGQRASQNPVSTVDAGGFSLKAGAAGTSVGKFGWITYDKAGGPGVVNSFTATGAVPDGFVMNEMQATNTVWLQEAGLYIPAGFPVGSLMSRGDFWAANPYADAAINQKVFANVFTGDVIGAATGSLITEEVGTSAVIASATTGAVGTYTLTINTLTSGTVEIGDQVLGLNIQGKVFIESFNTFNGSTGSVNLTLPIAVVQTAVALTAVAPGGIGGGIAASVSSSSSTTMTINSMTSGVIVVGQLVQAITSVPAGTYVSAIGTFDGTSGTIILSQATTGVISDQVCGFSAFIETPWYVTAAANVGDIVKIGIKN